MWVIERYYGSILHYWRPSLRGDDREDGFWDKDFIGAVKFADAESAGQVLRETCGNNGRVAEHAYIQRENLTAAAS